MGQANITERARSILASIVEYYIYHGQPVGSKTLAQVSNIGLSAASIRNIMADLEAMGYLLQPHTSAGRIPTTQGYRLFVDSLLTSQSVSTGYIEQLKQQLSSECNTQELVKKASSALSGLSHLTGVVTVPKIQNLTLRQIEFLPLTGNRILIILVLNEKDVQNRIIHTDRQFSESELRQASNFLNSYFAGKDLSIIKQDLIDGMACDKEHLDLYMQTILEVAGDVLNVDPQSEDEFVVAGEANLIEASRESSLDHLRQLFDAFTKKRDILHLLDRCIKTQGIQIFIGEESGFDAFGDFSMIAAPYRAHGQMVGVLGVIGPTRMHYEKVIPLVDITAKLMSLALED